LTFEVSYTPTAMPSREQMVDACAKVMAPAVLRS